MAVRECVCTDQMRASCDIPDTNYTVLLVCAIAALERAAEIHSGAEEQ